MRVAIVGGGAAGMMCAATIAEEYPRVEIFVLEKNASLGKKVIISGGGRCNVTTGIEDISLILEKYPRGNKFLQSAMHRFSPNMVSAWFEAHGVPLKCEDDLRMFPVSNNGTDIVAVFEDIFEETNVHVKYKHNVQHIIKKNTGFVLSFKDQKDLEVDKVVVALGGQAYRHTGSTGDGYDILEQLGHTITPLAPSLNSFLTKETWPKKLSGLSFQKATIFIAGQKKQYTSTGPFLFTHMGVSGPAIFALSARIAFLRYDKATPLAIQIDIFPDLTEGELLEKLQQTRKEHMQKTFKNTLPHLVAKSLAEELCILLDIPLEKKNADMSKKELSRVVSHLKGLPLNITGRGAGDEFVTAGGVELSEVDPKTMESKICPGLFFAGEILDVDGYTGGFNLQASWATGNAAGIAIGK